MSVDHVLVVDDDEISREYVYEALKQEGYDVVMAEDGFQATEKIDNKEFDLVITDMKMPRMDGLELMEKVKEASPETTIVIMTAYGTVESAVEAMKKGASDYIIKPFSPDQLKLLLERVEERRKLVNENKYWRAKFTKNGGDDLVFGKGSIMSKLHSQTMKVAQSKASVLIQGESGTGKELVARAIHVNSPRCNKPFIRVNCAALTETLLESELFGHEKGAYTGALNKREGRFELANEGTLLLDEITEISLVVQSKLLRVLEEEEFERVGGTKTIKVDVRIIATTNRDIVEEVNNGNFRQDLFYRLNVIPQYVAPLRERGDDIVLLAGYFFKKFKKESQSCVKSISSKAMQALCEYNWPGNVRELRNMVHRAILMVSGDEIGPEHFFEGYKAVDLQKTSEDNQVGRSIEDMEKELIMETLKYTTGNKEKAAKMLKITTRTLRNKLHKYGELDE